MSARNGDLTRRDFIKAAMAAIGGAVSAAVGLPALAFLLSPSVRAGKQGVWVDLGPLDTYVLNTPTLFQFADVQVNGWERTAVAYGAFVVRLDESRVRVFSNVCTHLGCRVTWHPDIQNYVSPCHDGHFDILGNVVSGPPPRPLDEFESRVEQGHLHIRLPAFKRTS